MSEERNEAYRVLRRSIEHALADVEALIALGYMSSEEARATALVRARLDEAIMWLARAEGSR